MICPDKNLLPTLTAVIAAAILLLNVPAGAVTTVFFAGSQTTNLVTSGTTSDTISSEGYLFTRTRDKLFTGGVGMTNPIGRSLRVNWPAGLEAQAVTTGLVLSGAKLTIKRQDGQPFDITQFTFKLLANTAGAGANLEVMPKLNGEDGLPDPVMFFASGYYGQLFSNNSPQLAGYDTYVLSLYVDFALMNFTAEDPSLPPPVLDFVSLDATSAQLSWPTNYTGFVLQQKTSLTAANWANATEPVEVAGENYQVTLLTTNSARFFRLRHP